MPVALRQPRRRHAVACTAAGCLAAILYLNALSNPFVYDDHRMVVENTGIQDLTDLRAIVLLEPTRPLINFSYAVDYAVWGLNPFGFHLTNLLLHVLNVVLLFQVAIRMVADRRRSGLTEIAKEPVVVGLGAALVFAAHPMMSQAVGYVAGRPELLCGTFFLLALLSGRRWMLGGGAASWILTVMCWIAALASKEVAAMFPFVLVLYDRLILHLDAAGTRRALVRLHVPLLLTAVVAAVARVAVLLFVEYSDGLVIGWQYVLLQFDVALRYITLLLVPRGQTVFHAVPPATIDNPRTWLAVVVVVGLVALAIRMRQRAASASFGLFWFLLLLVPSAALVVFDRGEPMAEHRIYVASMGLFLGVGAAMGAISSRLVETAPRLRLLGTVAFIVVLTGFAGRTIIRNAVWASPVGLWGEAVELAPDHWFPQLLFGEALHNAGRRDEAIRAYSRVIERRPEEAAAYQKLALGYAEQGRYAEARETFERLRRLDPKSPIPPNGLGAIALLTNAPGPARGFFLEALALDPPNVRARQALAAMAEQEPADYREALRLCQEIQQLAPRTPGNDDCIRRNQVRVAAMPR
jgi:tetratricopeptide (TPR) repeat protein